MLVGTNHYCKLVFEGFFGNMDPNLNKALVNLVFGCRLIVRLTAALGVRNLGDKEDYFI